MAKQSIRSDRLPSNTATTVVADVPKRVKIKSLSFNSRRKQQKTYLSFGTDYAHMIDVTESLILVNENIAQNVELE